MFLRKLTPKEPQLNRTRNSQSSLDRNFVPDIPQAGVLEEGLEQFADRNWREYFASQLLGRGLEIGPLHRPLPRHGGMQVDYIDRYTVPQLREHYPELKDLPLVEPTIIGDGETLSEVADQTYDFLIAAHVIEHTRNPISAIEQWCRVLKPGGLLYLIVPDKRITFDKQRVRTTLEHMILDYVSPSAERDFEHFLDYAVFVNKKQQWMAVEEAKRLCAEDYSIHFHVFLPSDVIRLVEWISANVRPIDIAEGPNAAPGSDEFHLLLRRAD
ncbi:MAG: methyltransferase domain-containing protein [Bdellovibrionota bacterium]